MIILLQEFIHACSIVITYGQGDKHFGGRQADRTHVADRPRLFPDGLRADLQTAI